MHMQLIVDEDKASTEKRTKSAQSEIQLSKIERVLLVFTDVPLLSARTELLGYWDAAERELQEAIYLVGGNLRLLAHDTKGKKVGY